jgi:Uma2 family endonuclease
MSRPAPVAKMSYAQYRAAEQGSPVRHEFLNGEVFAMAGGTPEHAALMMAVGAQLVSALRGKPCRVYSADLRVRIQDTGLTTYPDLSVVCDRPTTAASRRCESTC